MSEEVLSLLEKSVARVPAHAFAHEVDRDIPVREAAVLFGFWDRPQGLELVLTLRHKDLRAHGGQVAFPGGVREDGDESPEATALREAGEEVNLDPRHVAFLGRGRRRITGTGFIITPCFAQIARQAVFMPDLMEVERIFTIPVAEVLNLSRYTRLIAEYGGVERPHLVFEWEGYHIWGATAGMMRDFCRLILDEVFEEEE